MISIGRALYQEAALFNNNCVPSCSRAFSGQEVTFYTTRLVLSSCDDKSVRMILQGGVCW